MKKDIIRQFLDNINENQLNDIDVTQMKKQLKDLIAETPAIEFDRGVKIQQVKESNGVISDKRENYVKGLKVIFVNENEEIDVVEKTFLIKS